MIDAYRDAIAYWQALGRQAWPGIVPERPQEDAPAGPRALVEFSLEFQRRWWRGWQEVLTSTVPAAFDARAFETATDAWIETQRRLWNGFGGAGESRPGPRAASVPAPRKPAREQPKTTRRKSPAAATASRARQRDDLKQIAGIGPALEKKLNAEGIVSFGQVAALKKADIERLEQTVIRFAGRITRENWVGQAKKLARA